MKQGMLLLALVGTLALGVFTGPDLWAAPGQNPYRQTLATATPPPSPVETETPTPTPTPTETPTPTFTETPTFTPTPTVTPTLTSTPTTTPTLTSTPTSTFTPSPTRTPAPTAVPGAILGYHTVRAGETLYCIGRAYGVDPFAIAVRNGIVNPSRIYVGQVLAIPNAPRLLPPGPVCPRQFGGATPRPSTCRWYHTVRWGENLYRISLRYGVSMWTIAEANHIYNLHYIRAGQVLCIP
jgi:LysM repeat protein